MDESDLGDFFAKKDRKKKKKKQGTKVTSATLIEQLISDPGKTEEQPKQQFTDEAHIARPDDNEWIEIDNDHLAEGLSDLKIKSLDAKEEEEEAIRQQEIENQECESEDENGTENKGPWAPVSSSPPKTFSSMNKPKSNVPSIPSSIVSSSGKYIPPGQRSGAPAVSASRSRGREQINVNSVDQFPDLHAQTNKPKEKHDPTFDMAKGGGRKIQKQAKTEQMQLNNKFKVLES